MPIPKYAYNGPVDHAIPANLANIKGKSVIVTGGANGMGEAMVRQFVADGAFVTFGDLHPRGTELEEELNANGAKTAFVKCDIRDWDDQVKLFETAKTNSPHNSVDVVIANAGISRSSGDSLWTLDGKLFEGVPSLKLRLVMTTMLLAGHHRESMLTGQRRSARATKEARPKDRPDQYRRHSIFMEVGCSLLPSTT
jgi:NAD(P)-dependent dehydrogenase (short-subunit alcohol dehydrogenase family)